ncbi:MAG: YdcF family protein [Flammeovirgaceae bacterium]|nr:YdcF family protein [Flammeovirgaceae bacterium]
MFFTLSKILHYLAMPLVLVCGFFLASVLIKRQPLKKRLFRTGFVLLFFFSNEFISNEVMTWWEGTATPYASTQACEWGIVLTGVTGAEREPGDRIYFSRGADRVYHAVDLYKRGLIKKILVSGGTGRLIPTGEGEAREIKKAMTVMGVPDSLVMVESESRNTHESAEMSKAILDSLGASSPSLLITSGFHMVRSTGCFEKTGVEVIPFRTDFYSHPRYFTPDVLFIPKLSAMLNWQKMLKEWTGIIAYWLAGYI